MSSYKYFLMTIMGACLSCTLISCATHPPAKPVTPAPLPSHPAVTTAPLQASTPGTYHTVQNGETLWRISRIYNVPVDLIRQVNHLTGSTIKVGTRLVIPVATGIGSTATATVNEVGRATSGVLLAPIGLSEGNFIWPLRGRIATGFGEIRDNVTSKGIDILAPSGQSIIASKSGAVSFVSESVKGYGKMIIVDHSGGYQTVYAFNSENLVQEGQRVKQGQVIARVGTSPSSHQSSLHFEIRKSHEPLNPQSLLRG